MKWFIYLCFLLMSLSLEAQERGLEEVVVRAPDGRVTRLYDNSWAVLIGVNDYTHWPRLSYAVADVAGMKNALVEKLGFPEANIFTLINENVTLENMKTLLGVTLPEKAKSNDRVLIFYAGHGGTRNMPSGGDLGFLIPFDAPTDEARFVVDCLSMRSIKEFASLMPAKHVLFLVDACYSGLAVDASYSTTERPFDFRFADAPIRQVITAGRAGEQVIERDEWGHSAFAYQFLQGMKSGLADTDGDGLVTGTELAGYLKPRVTLVSGNLQTPVFRPWGGEGEFVFVLKEGERDISTVNPQELILRGNEYYERGLETSDMSLQYTLFNQALEFYQASGTSTGRDMGGTISAKLDSLRDVMGYDRVGRMLDTLMTMMAEERFQEAYSKLLEMRELGEEDTDIGQSNDFLQAQIDSVEKALQEKWYHWSLMQRVRAARQHIVSGKQSLDDGKPFQAWESGYRAHLLTYTNTQADTLMMDAQAQVLQRVLQSEVSVADLIDRGVYKIIWNVVRAGDTNPFSVAAAQVLRDHQLTLDDLASRIAADSTAFIEAHRDWFYLGPASDDDDIDIVMIPEPQDQNEEDNTDLGTTPTVVIETRESESENEVVSGTASTQTTPSPVPHNMVVVDDRFYIDKFEATHADYVAFLNAKGNQTEGGRQWLEVGDSKIYYRNGRFGVSERYAKHPVVEVSWYGAQAYCNWAGKRLPTGREWRLACQGRERREYPWGNEAPNAGGIYRANYAGGDAYRQTAPVGSFDKGSSSYGALDMAGNVWEWIAESYVAGGKRRAYIRGGSYTRTEWSDLSCNMRGASVETTVRTYHIGFRCVKDMVNH